MPSRAIGFAEVVVAGICFGWLGFFGKKAFEAGMTPTELLALRYGVAAIVLGFALAVRLAIQNSPRGELAGRGLFDNAPSRPANPATMRKEAGTFCGGTFLGMAVRGLILGAGGYAVFSSFFFVALKGLSASLTVLLLYTYPAMVAIGAQIFLKERLARGAKWALPLSAIGLVALVWGEWTVSAPSALVFGILSAVFYSAYILISRVWLRGEDPYTSTFFVLIGASVALCAVTFRDLERPLTLLRDNGWLILAMAIVCSVMAMSLFLSGLHRLTSAETAILSLSEPVSGVLIAVLLLGESMTGVQLVGGCAVLFSMILTTRRSDRSEN